MPLQSIRALADSTEESAYACGKAEHIHGPECYETQRVLACRLEEESGPEDGVPEPGAVGSEPDAEEEPRRGRRKALVGDMNLAEWGGVIGFAVALIASVLACRRILRRAPRNTDTSGDNEYDKLVMSSILPRDQGTSIDKVAEALKGQELGSFSLVGAKDSEWNL